MSRYDGFVHAFGDQILNGQGVPLRLRGIGLGNWLLPEGYMWKFDKTSPRQIEDRVRELVGTTRADEFWSRFRDNFITERDVERIASLGYDHVRLPVNSRYLVTDDGVFIEEGFARIDDLIAWCRRHDLWVLLDLHGAPGGQTGTNIDDSPNGKPELFMEARWYDLTVRLWEEIARRYRHETAVLGYDLLNEPLPNEWQDIYADELTQLYRDITSAIRAVDPDHMIVYEGSHWGTNWKMFREVWDTNSALQFHRYWCPPEEIAIVDYLATRESLGLPIYMGEGGENTPEWIYTAFRLYERHDIGWNFWTWKKLDTLTSPVSAARPKRWELIADFDTAVAADEAWDILEEFLHAIELERCVENPEIVNATFGRAPLTIPAWGHTPNADMASLADGPMKVWHHPRGQRYAEDEAPKIVLRAGVELRYALSDEPSHAALDADAPEHLSTDWSNGNLIVRASGPAELRAITLIP